MKFSFDRLVLFLAGFTSLMGAVLAAEPEAVQSSPDVVIYEGRYPGWPWIITSRDGTMHCVFREGTAHGFSAEGKALITHSTDHGKTWSPVTVIVDEPGVDDRNVAIVELPSGDLFVTYNTYAMNRETKKTTSQIMSIRSTDGGRTWGTPVKGPVENSQSKSAAVVLSNGTLFWPFYIAPSNGARGAISSDSGRTWDVIEIPESAIFRGDEWDLVEAEPGRLLAIMRNANRKGPTALCFSESLDFGKTWTVPQPTNLNTGIFAPGQIFLQGKRKTPTVLYPDRRLVSVSAVRTHDPEFLKWDVEHQLPCYRYLPDESRIPDGSYAVSAPTGPRQRLVVDYEIRPEVKRIAGYLVDFPEDW